MMLVSTFELLVSSQLPRNASIPAPFNKLGRTVIQGYFLTLANVTNSNITVSLIFTALTPSVNIADTFTFLDVDGTNLPGDLTPDLSGTKARFNNLTIPANDTCLFILQPDIVKDNGALLNTADFEVRGYVEIVATSLSQEVGRLLLTPEHRGTFFKDLNAADPQLDQFVCPLPMPSGGSLFELRRSEGRREQSRESLVQV